MARNEEGLPSLKKDLQNSILFLQQCGASGGDSLFDHLSNVISKVIDERPKNVVDYFEQFSERVRLETFRMDESLLEKGYKEPQRLVIAQKLLPKLIEKSKQPIKDAADEEEETLEQSMDDEEGDVIYHEPPARDLCELQFYWNLLGIGFPREEVFSIVCSVAKLKKTNPTMASCRFWGKMLGLKNDYYIVESTLTVSTLEDTIDAIENAINITSLEASEESVLAPAPSRTSANSEVENNNDKDKDNGSDLRSEVEEYPAGWNFSMKVPDSQYRPPVEIPAEQNGHGVNRHVYYVATNLGDEWIELPPTTPHQINVTRRIKKYLCGNLDEPIEAFPSFPGTERNYLRALIARISAGTHISPRGFFIHKVESNEMDDEKGFDDSDDGDDASLNNDKPITENESYQNWSLSKLLKLDFWEHHKPEILRQGRVCYFDGTLLGENDNQSDASSDASNEEDETEAANNETKPETPIPLFASCSGDRLTNDAMSPWTIRLSDVVETLVSVQSRVWHGAFAFVKDRTYDNIYIGYGHKYSTTNYAPPAIPRPAVEYLMGPDDIEDEDITIKEEKVFAARTNDLEHDFDSADEDEVDTK